MKGIILLLPDELDARVRAAQAHLQQAVGLHTIPSAPHVTVHVAEGYADVAVAAEQMQAMASATSALCLKMAGLGVFRVSADEAVIYLTVVRSPALDAVRASLFEALADVTVGFHPLYAADEHVPHITVGHVSAEKLPEAMAWLFSQSWQFDFVCNAMGLVEAVGDTFVIGERAAFGAA